MHKFGLHVERAAGARGRRKLFHWHSRHRATSLAAVLTLVAAALGLWQTAAQAAGTAYNFQLDGDIAASTFGNFSGSVPTNTFDWSDFLAADSNGDVTTSPTLPDGSLPNYITSSASPDYALPDTSVFATGSKDTLPISGWQCGKKNNLGAKDDLLNAYQTAWTAGNGDLVVIFGAEKSSNLGDNNIAIWLLQDGSVACDSSGGNKTFTGAHQEGDLLLAAAFTNGGGTAKIDVYKWHNGALTQVGSENSNICSSSMVLPDPTSNTHPDAVCAITNTSSVDPPWTSPAKTLDNGGLASEEFYEGALDVTSLLGGSTPCFNTTITDTRSSQSDTATIFDFVAQGFHTCGGTSLQTVAAKASPATLDSSGGSTDLTFYEKNDGSDVLTDPHVNTFLPDGTSLTDCDNSMSPPANAEGIGGSAGALSTALTAGATYTSLSLDGTGTAAIAAGDPLQIGSGASEQTVVASAAAAAGASSVSVNSFVANGAYDVGTAVTDIAAGGDVNNNGDFDPGETWAFTCTTTSITTTTTITAIGHGTDAFSKDVTFCGSQLATALTNGQAGVTSLHVTAISKAIASGDSIKIGFGTASQTVTASAAASAGATSIPVSSFTTTHAYAIGTPVADTNYAYPCNADEVTQVTVTVINPSTSLVETAAADITYTFKETNDGDSPLTSPAVTPGTGQCTTGPTESKSGGFNIGDDGGTLNVTGTAQNGILDPTETWVWTCTHHLDGPSGGTGTASELNTGTGHGTDVSQNDITYCVTADSGQKCDSSERDSVLVSIQNNAQGASPDPVAVNDTYSTAASSTLTVSVANGVLKNDTPSTGVTVAESGGPLSGLTLNANGSFTFNAPASTGDYTFDYENTDVTTGQVSSAATVTIHVT